MSADAARQERLGRVLAALGERGVEAVPLPSDSNDVWRLGRRVLRVCYRGDRARFAREAAVTAALPASIRAPRLLEHGDDGDLAWQVSELVGGVPLGQVWPALDAAQRRHAVHRVGELLAELNAHRFPAAVRTALSAPRPAGSPGVAEVLGADLNPLPLWRARLLLEPAAAVPGVDRALVDAVGRRFDELEVFDPLGERHLAQLGGGVVVHGDAHPANVLWDDGAVTLLDFEWVRLGSPELEVQPFLQRGLTTPPSLVADSADVLRWLSEAHPAAFAAAALVPRLWLVELAHALRHLLLWPPDRPEPQLPADHPLPRLRSLVRGPGHLSPGLPGARDR